MKKLLILFLNLTSIIGYGQVSFKFHQNFFGKDYVSHPAWSDYDRDGYLDLLATLDGYKLYQNSDGIFIEIGSFEKLTYSDAEWGDFDADGDLDFIISGTSDLVNSLLHALIYKNDNGNSSRNDAPFNPTAKWAFSLEWGDLDNNGKLDMVSSGRLNQGNPSSEIIYDNGVKITSLTGASSYYGKVTRMGDFDNDGHFLNITLSTREPSENRIFTT